MVDEVPRKNWDKIPGLQRLHDTIGVMASGSITNPLVLNGLNTVAGIDVLTHEARPMADEPPGNAYHYVLQETTDSRYPFLLHGPYRSKTIVDHWFDAPQLDRYWQGESTATDATSGEVDRRSVFYHSTHLNPTPQY